MLSILIILMWFNVFAKCLKLCIFRQCFYYRVSGFYHIGKYFIIVRPNYMLTYKFAVMLFQIIIPTEKF